MLNFKYEHFLSIIGYCENVRKLFGQHMKYLKQVIEVSIGIRYKRRLGYEIGIK